MSNSVIAIIVTYNRLKNLKKAVETTLKQNFTAVIVVNNASHDGTEQWLNAQQKTQPRLNVLTLPENRGGAGGFQAGMQLALAQFQADWLLLFDDDAYSAPTLLENLADFNKNNKNQCDAIACAVYYPNGDICEMNRPSWNPFWHKSLFWQTFCGIFTARSRAGFHIKNEHYQQHTPTPVDCSSFVGLLVRTQWAKNHPLPNGELFIYGDDLLYTLQLSAAGGRLLFVPSMQFFHDCTTFTAHKKTYSPLWKAYFTYRNGLIIYRQAAGYWFYLAAPLKILSWLLAVRFYPQKRQFLRLWRLAVTDGLRQNTSRPPQEIINTFS